MDKNETLHGDWNSEENASGNYDHRHPSTQHMMKMLVPNPNLKGLPAEIADNIWGMADRLVSYHKLDNSPEVTAGLRKLLEAKDCFVRAAVFGPTVEYKDR